MSEKNITRLAGMAVLGCTAVAAGSLLRMAWLRREILQSVSKLGEMTTTAVSQQVALRRLAESSRYSKEAGVRLRLLEAGMTTQLSCARRDYQRHQRLVGQLQRNWAIRVFFLPQWRASAFESLEAGVRAHGGFVETLEQQSIAAQELVARAHRA